MNLKKKSKSDWKNGTSAGGNQDISRRNESSHGKTGKRQEETKESQEEIKGQIGRIERQQEETKKFQEEMKAQMERLEKRQEETKQNVDEIRKQLAEIMVRLEKALPSSQVNKNGAQALDRAIPDNNKDVIVIGGYGSLPPEQEHILSTVEKYSIATKNSTSLPNMNIPRAEATSCVYNGDVMIVGGWVGHTDTETIEILTMNQRPLQWKMFEGKLPCKLSAHAAVCHDGKLYVIGGYNWGEDKASDAIHEVLLTPPYTCKLLTRMPQPRQNHTAAIVKGNLFVLGGSTTDLSKDAIDSVLVYDIVTKEMKKSKSLPMAVSLMSSVTLDRNVILIGGVNMNLHILNNVIMYNSVTEQYEKLPSLKHKRYGCSAVIMHDVITVFGGYNEDDGCLNSVETLKIGDKQWKVLPAMKEKRRWLTCVVKPLK